MIKTIIFDFGDVFLDLDKAATYKELEKMEIKALPENFILKNQQYEKGLITSKEFIDSYCNSYPQLSKKSFTNSWNAILLKFPKHRLRFLQRLSKEKKYRLILLSNTNDIHIDWVKQNVDFFEDFKECFDAFYLSQELNLRKPEPSVFQFVLEKHQLIPEETLFIDDTFENTTAAAKLGFHVWNIDPSQQDVTDLFKIKKELF